MVDMIIPSWLQGHMDNKKGRPVSVWLQHGHRAPFIYRHVGFGLIAVRQAGKPAYLDPRHRLPGRV